MVGGIRNPLSVSHMLEQIGDAVGAARDKAHGRKESLARKMAELGIAMPFVDLTIQVRWGDELRVRWQAQLVLLSFLAHSLSGRRGSRRWTLSVRRIRTSSRRSMARYRLCACSVRRVSFASLRFEHLHGRMQVDSQREYPRACMERDLARQERTSVR